MRNKLQLLALCITIGSANSLFAQENSELLKMPSLKKRHYETNILAPVRFNQAINFAVVNTNRSTNWATVIGGDLIFNRFEYDPEDARLLNGFQTNLRGVGFNLVFGARKYQANSWFNYGFEAHYGFLPFQHTQLICIETESLGDLCRCNVSEIHKFNTVNHRLGLMFRIGMSVPLGEKFGLELYGMGGLYTYFRSGFDGQRNHVNCNQTFNSPNADMSWTLENFVDQKSVVPGVRTTIAIQLGLNLQFGKS
jgi:hypothetical protein